MSDEYPVELALRRKAIASTATARRHLPVEHFHCELQSATLTRGTCASRWATYNKRDKLFVGRTGTSCTGCKIGKKHAAGKVPRSAPAIPPPKRTPTAFKRQKRNRSQETFITAPPDWRYLKCTT